MMPEKIKQQLLGFKTTRIVQISKISIQTIMLKLSNVFFFEESVMIHFCLGHLAQQVS